ncbi:MAG: hypothetical protein L6W00_22870 [Lentisphaeria bacterium]|nr:MAG: hypothetical protein L6W00_22870 [Lentisphaeria bacterium]
MDKPGGEKLEPFRELLNEFRRKHLTIQLGYMYRNNPAVQYCLEAVRKGWLGGDLRSARGDEPLRRAR